ncbi:MAG: type II secretion system F family protein [Candidatus Sericytochromatia bacterium]|nr:type II secretion system F family protein [Candidatus Tanganyikabacteria bacterium]
MLSGKTRALLYRQLGDMARSGMAIERVFALSAASRKGKLGAALELAAARLRNGSSLEDALRVADAKYPGLFASWELKYIAFGEKAGHLPDFLLQIADQAEEAHTLTTELIGGFAYPLFLLYLTILVGPLAKLILQGPAAYLGTVAGPFLGITVLLGGAVAGLLQPGSRRAILAALRPVPLLGKMVGTAALYRTITALALAYRGGLPVDQAWPLASQASEDAVLIDAGKRIQAQILAGREVAPVLERLPAVFPVPVRTAYQTGEATGNLDGELLHAAGFLRRDLEVLRKSAVKVANTGFYLLVAAFMAGNVLDIYRGPMAQIDQIYRDLP